MLYIRQAIVPVAYNNLNAKSDTIDDEAAEDSHTAPAPALPGPAFSRSRSSVSARQPWVCNLMKPYK